MNLRSMLVVVTFLACGVAFALYTLSALVPA